MINRKEKVMNTLKIRGGYKIPLQIRKGEGQQTSNFFQEKFTKEGGYKYLIASIGGEL